MATNRDTTMTPRKREDYIGERYGRLTVTAVSPRKQRVTVTCDCGVVKDVFAPDLSRGHSKSCGCLNKELVAARSETHKGSHTPLYAVWSEMRARCNNPNHAAFKHYGARGITVCESWGTFKQFLLDMGDRPEGMSLDRIDNNKGYSPQNCRWATRKQQAENTRQNRLFDWFGVRRPLSVICTEVGRNYRTALNRLNRGWTFERSIFTPVRSW